MKPCAQKEMHSRLNFIRTVNTTTMSTAILAQQPAKKIIKLTQAQLREVINYSSVNKAPTSLPALVCDANNAPLISKKTSGQFNDADIQIDIDKGDLNEMSTQLFNTNDLINDLMNSDETSFTMEPPPALEDQIGDPNGAKHLNLDSQLAETSENSQYALKLTEEEWGKLFEGNSDLLNNFGYDSASLDKALNQTNPFASLFGDETIVTAREEVKVSPLLLDHVYTRNEPAETNKRKLSLSLFDETTQDSVATSSVQEGASATPKKQRARGIYRADDVTNADELQNYLERRKKNNMSSKASRANKKSLYNEMDAKSDFLEVENKRLVDRIGKLEHLNKLIKDMLVEKFAGK